MYDFIIVNTYIERDDESGVVTLSRAAVMVWWPTERPWTKLRAATNDRRTRVDRRRGVEPNGRSRSTWSATHPLFTVTDAVGLRDGHSSSRRTASCVKNRSSESDRLRSVPCTATEHADELSKSRGESNLRVYSGQIG